LNAKICIQSADPFTQSASFSGSLSFLQSGSFIASSSFIQSALFIASAAFTQSASFSGSRSFTESYVFSRSDTAIVMGDPDDQGPGLSGAALGGAIGGGFAALAVLALLLLFLLKRRKQEEVEEGDETLEGVETTTIEERDDYISEYGLSAPGSFNGSDDDGPIDLPREGESGISDSDPMNISENKPEDLDFRSDAGEGL
jgi:hypothetical protein